MAMVEALWETVPVSASGLVVMMGPPTHHQEIELLSCDNVSVVFINSDALFKKGVLVLTTHRVLFRSGTSSSVPRGISLADIRDVSMASSMFSNQKIKLKIREVEMRFVFHKQGCDKFHESLLTSIKAQEWLPLPSNKVETKDKKPFSTHSAGIGGILRSVAQEQVSADKVLNQAFQDLDSLMSYAKEMVELAERFATKTTSSNDEDESEFRSILHQMGIANPVTKQNAGSHYHLQLARQLADFLSKVLSQSGGVLMLVDVYCLFNRARGTELISPDDLLTACKSLSDLNMGLSLRQFDSGVLAVQSSEHDDMVMARKILESIEQNGPITDLELSKHLNVSIHLAKEHLLTAERNEFLCRDSVLEATRFYKNIFI